MISRQHLNNRINIYCYYLLLCTPLQESVGVILEEVMKEIQEQIKKETGDPATTTAATTTSILTTTTTTTTKSMC